jgi:hypothetical protein
MAKRGVKKHWFKHHKEDKERCNCHCCHGGKGCGFYFLGFLGALIYYLQTGQGFLGFLKAIVWPVFVVMKILGA